MKVFYIILFNCLLIPTSLAQCTDWTNFQTLRDTFTNPALGNATTPERDRTGKPYVYLACTNIGLKIYDISTPETSILVHTIESASLEDLSVINLVQDSIYLFATLGDIWSSDEPSGLAIIDVSSPDAPVILDTYSLPGSQGGAGAVALQGDYAYLAGMDSGLIILDVSDKSNIQLVSQLPILNNFPHNQIGGDQLYNARGIDVKDSIAYVCHDRGALRLINVADVTAPYEMNQYVFSDLIDHATAYNNVLVHDNLAFVAIDYYGVEILNISDPNNIQQLAWWHPSTWAPATNDIGVWSNALGHANELAYDAECEMLYVSGGKSDVIALDVSDLNNVTACETYGSTSDQYGTWGLDLYDQKVYIAYIWAPFTPPHSNFTGFSELQITPCVTVGLEETFTQTLVSIFPNPVNHQLHVEATSQIDYISIFDAPGKKIISINNIKSTGKTVDVSTLQTGIYFIEVKTNRGYEVQKFIKSN